MDTTLIGTTAASLMDTLPDESGGEIVAVGIVVVVDDGDHTYTKTMSSTDMQFETVGLFATALEIVKDPENVA